MFIVKCAVAGTLSVILEKGSVNLTNGQNFDIEEYCSRRWIKSDPVLNRFIKAGHLVVVFDSEDKIPGHPTGDAVRSKSAKTSTPGKEPETVIVDFSGIPDPGDLDKVDDFVEGKITKEELGLPAKSVDVLEDSSEDDVDVSPENEAEESKVFSKEFLESLGWNELRKTAKELGLKTYRKSADELIEDILNQEK